MLWLRQFPAASLVRLLPDGREVRVCSSCGGEFTHRPADRRPRVCASCRDGIERERRRDVEARRYQRRKAQRGA